MLGFLSPSLSRLPILPLQSKLGQESFRRNHSRTHLFFLERYTFLMGASINNKWQKKSEVKHIFMKKMPIVLL